MAIDPNIALGVRPVEPLDLTKLQQLRNLVMQEQATAQQIAASRAQEELVRAQIPGVAIQQERIKAEIPGVAAESAIRARVAEGQRWVAENITKYRDPITGEIDRRKLSNGMTSAGYPELSDSYMKAHLDNLQAMSNMATQEQARNSVTNKATNDLISHTANTLQFLRDEPSRIKTLQLHAEYAEKLFPGSGQQLIRLLGTQMPDGSVGVDMKKVEAINNSSMTPLEAANLVVAQQGAATSAEAVRQAGILNTTGPEARDPSSALSRQAREFAINAGVPGVTPDMSAAAVNNLAGYKQAVAASVISGEVKGAMAAAANSRLEAANLYDNTVNVLKRLKDAGRLAGSNNVSTFISSKAATLQNIPDFRALQGLINNLTAINPNINVNIGADSLITQLTELGALARKDSDSIQRTLPATTYKETVTPRVQLIKMITPAGKIVDVHPENETMARGMGYKRVTK